VTANPTAEWIARQITEVFPWDAAPRYLIRDRDTSYGMAVTRRLRVMGIRDRPIAPCSPWQNGHVERLIGSILSECLDHVVVLREASSQSVGQLLDLLQWCPQACHWSLVGSFHQGMDEGVLRRPVIYFNTFVPPSIIRPRSDPLAAYHAPGRMSGKGRKPPQQGSRHLIPSERSWPLPANQRTAPSESNYQQVIGGRAPRSPRQAVCTGSCGSGREDSHRGRRTADGRTPGRNPAPEPYQASPSDTPQLPNSLRPAPAAIDRWCGHTRRR
jgi:hypothetical protein